MRWLLFALLPVSVWAAFPGLRYLDEIGHLDTPSDSRTSIRIGRTQVVATKDGTVFRGRDDNSNRWQATLPITGGVTSTTVWQADFDHNSRPDLLIAAYSFVNGRCIDEVTLSFLMFDNHGRPVPWVIQTHAPSRLSRIFTDLNHNGRAELVVTDCAYSDPSDTSRLGEDRRITGIYEAKDVSWSLIQPAHLDAYTTLVHKSLRLHAPFARLFPPNPVEWADQGNRSDARAAPPVQVIAVMTPDETCRGTVPLPPVVNGRLQVEGWRDPCTEIGHNRIKLSDGTVCYDWPTVMLDRASGREIAAEPAGIQSLLEEIKKEHRRVVLAGQRDRARCSPVLLWAFPP